MTKYKPGTRVYNSSIDVYGDNYVNYMCFGSATIGSYDKRLDLCYVVLDNIDTIDRVAHWFSHNTHIASIQPDDIDSIVHPVDARLVNTLREAGYVEDKHFTVNR